MRSIPKCLSGFLLAAALLAQPKEAPKIEVQTGVSGVLAPGASFSITIKGDTAHKITPHSIRDANKYFEPLQGTQQGGDSFRFTLPETRLDPGPYYFTLADDGQIVPGGIDVESDKIKLLSVHAYRRNANTFDFDLTGENFSLDSQSDNVLIDGEWIIKGKSFGATADATACSGKPPPCLWVESARSMHVVGYTPGPYQGIVSVGIRVGNVVPDDRQQLALARHTGAVVILLSAAVTAALFWMISSVVQTGLANNKVGRRRLNLYQSFIFDPETNSYSLSKFQLLVFSGTFIFGYIYVLLSRWLVQWQFVLPDVPSTIAGLLGISGGTTVASAGLTSARGAKGAGLQHPTGADLITTGGVVVPERFQFFVWTIVACGGFIALLIGKDPAKVDNFPDLPQGLLYVMGVSAAGYLGGKAARKPGPSLENVGVQKPTDKPWTVLQAQGQNLATDGRYFIDEQELKFPTDDDRKKFPNLPAKLVTGVPQTGASDTNFCTRLDIIVANSSLDLSKGDHTFRIVNRDGQFADIAFSASFPVITSVFEQDNPPPDTDPERKRIRPSDKEVSIVIKGLELVAGSSVDWQAPGKTDFESRTPMPGGPDDGTEIWVSFVPGTTVGCGKINVTTPKGFVASAAVNVGDTSQPPPPPVAAKPAPGEQKAQPTETAKPTAGDQQAQPTETAKPAPGDQQAQPTETAKLAPGDQQAQPTETAKLAPGDQQAQPTETAKPTAGDQQAQPTETAKPAPGDQQAQPTETAKPAAGDEQAQPPEAAKPEVTEQRTGSSATAEGVPASGPKGDASPGSPTPAEGQHPGGG